VVQARTEAEAQCAFMANCGAADYAASQDYDSMLFGAKTLVRNLTIAGRRKLPRSNQTVEVFPEKFLLEENLRTLGIDQKKLIWIGILCGTDFNRGVYGIGAKKGYKAVKEAKRFEDVLKSVGGDIPKWKEVEGIFSHPDVFEPQKEELKFCAPDKGALMRFMCDQRGFSQERVAAALSRAFKIPEDGNQNVLGKWM